MVVNGGEAEAVAVLEQSGAPSHDPDRVAPLTSVVDDFVSDHHLSFFHAYGICKRG